MIEGRCKRCGTDTDGQYAFIAERQSDDGCTVAHIICFPCFDAAQRAGEDVNWDPVGAHFV